jgi:gluconate 2-dehydrogenase gamma chain
MMAKKGTLARRDFVIGTVAAGTAFLSGCRSSRRGGWEFLTEESAGTLKAICDQIIPADDFPSASEAGVLDYIDRQLVRHYRRHQKTYSEGLKQADRISRKCFGSALEGASAERQAAVVSKLEAQNASFFEMVRRHTFEGFYGSPRHGGNRDAVSWRMVGIAEPPQLGRAQYDLRKGSPS